MTTAPTSAGRLADTHLHVARLVLEAQSALSIGARAGGERDDLILVVDAAGLPTLPASGLAGALRAAVRAQHGLDMADRVFGHLAAGGQRSRLFLSWGVCHGADDRPLETVASELQSPRWHSELVQRLRALAQQPEKRDRVALDHRGTARPTGKFDRSVVPRGTRFTLELRMASASADCPDWQAVLALLLRDGLRVGGATRAGLGRLRVQRAHARSFDLRQPEQAQALRELPARFDESHRLPRLTLPEPATAATNTAVVSARIELQALAYLRIGQGEGALQPRKDDSAHLLTQKTEQVVHWQPGAQGDSGSLRRSGPLLPAASIKGALASRCAFHALRHRGDWLEQRLGDGEPEALASFDKNLEVPEVQALFGFASGQQGARAGRVLIDDVWLDKPGPQGLGRLTRNVIDRFTGGVREHLLFSEEALYRPRFCVDLKIRQPEVVPAAARRALREALDDLVSGLLPLGAGSSHGHGWCEGEVVWSDGGHWIQGEPA